MARILSKLAMKVLCTGAIPAAVIHLTNNAKG
jgi:hypothetical protein